MTQKSIQDFSSFLPLSISIFLLRCVLYVFLIYVYEPLSVYMSIPPCAFSVCGGQKRASDSRELKS